MNKAQYPRFLISNFEQAADISAKLFLMTDGRGLLEDSLRPASMFLRCNGLVFDFFSATTENRPLFIARCLFTGLTMSLLLMMNAFESFQFVIAIVNDHDILEVVITCTLSSFISVALLAQYQYVIRRKEFQEFFNVWKKVEMQNSKYRKRIKPKRKRQVLQVLYFSNLLLTLVMVPILAVNHNFQQPNSLFFPSFYAVFRDTLGMHSIYVIMMMFSYFTLLYCFLGETVSSLFFYHAGCVIEDLAREVQHTSDFFFSRKIAVRRSDGVLIDTAFHSIINTQFRQAKPFRWIWQRYETVIRSVNRGNQLFGVFILCSQFINFLHIIMLIFTCFKLMKTSTDVAASTISACMVVTLRAILTNRLMSHLYLSRGKLQSAIGGLLSDKWYFLPNEDRELLVSFHVRLAREDLAACPMNLFKINPTNLLTMLSLIVAYMVMIFQADADC